MNLAKIKKIHFIGIGGIGVSAIAKLMLHQKKSVSGSDSASSEITQEIATAGGKIFIGHKTENLANDVELVVFSPAISSDNPEFKKAQELKIPLLSYPQFLGILSKKLWTISVSGTNGKSTTTALTSLILEKDNFDPTVIVGSKIKSFSDGNLRIGKSKYFVVEACEYKESMLNLFPKMIILTNIEEDHLDYYKDLNHIKSSFQKYIKSLPKNGILIYNADDQNCVEISNPQNKKISFGINTPADIMAKDIHVKNQKQNFTLQYKNKILGKITLNVPGIFNIYNALTAIAATLTLKVSFTSIQKALKDFTGIWRRYEYIGEYKGAKIISDYAHHPTAIKNTLKATKEFFPNRRIIAVFQPHSWNRTKKLFFQFVESFDDADIIILSEVYQVSGRENLADKISSQELVDAIKSAFAKSFDETKQNQKEIFYAANPQKALQITLKNLKSNDILLIMGAGDIYRIIDKINVSQRIDSTT